MGSVEPLRIDSAEGERSLSYLYDPEGGCHFTRTRSDIATREEDLPVSFRVLEVGRWKAAMGPDLILQVEKYREMLLEQAELRSLEREEGYTSCGLLDRIRRLNICRDPRQLEKFMKGLFGGSDEGNLGLRDFLSPGMGLPADPFPCKQGLRLANYVCNI